MLTIFLNFIENAPPDLDHPALKNDSSEKIQGGVRKIAGARIFEMVSIQVLENFFHAKHENCEFSPLIAVLFEKLLAASHLALQSSVHSGLDVALNSLLIDLVELRGFIKLVTQLHDASVSFHVLFWILFHGSCVQVVEKNLKVFVDFTLSIC
jgi:hypothetical protein